VELGNVRGEVDAGLKRLDVVIQELDSVGLGQGRKALGWVHKPMLRSEPKGKNVLIPKITGVGLGFGPKDCKVGRSFKRPMEVGKGPLACLGLVAGSCELVTTVDVGLGLGPIDGNVSGSRLGGSSKSPIESEEG
jgi:hypothetical protein